jgi:hypothetical protein
MLRSSEAQASFICLVRSLLLSICLVRRLLPALSIFAASVDIRECCVIMTIAACHNFHSLLNVSQPRMSDMF